MKRVTSERTALTNHQPGRRRSAGSCSSSSRPTPPPGRGSERRSGLPARQGQNGGQALQLDSEACETGKLDRLPTDRSRTRRHMMHEQIAEILGRKYLIALTVVAILVLGNQALVQPYLMQ